MEKGNKKFRGEEKRDGVLPDDKLRSSDYDLKIIVIQKISENDDTNDIVPAVSVSSRKEYHVYSQVFCRHSKFIDVSLSVDMKEKAIKEIYFNDVSPDLFELAIQYLEDPIATRAMTATDALQVIEFYSKYEFTGGLRLCDHLLAEFIDSYRGQDQGTFPDFNIDHLVNACEYAHRFQLEKTTKAAIEFARNSLIIGSPYHFGAAIFTQRHIEQLHSLLIYYADELNLQDLLRISREEMESYSFPKHLLEKKSNLYTNDVLTNIQLSVSGINQYVDGDYYRSRAGGENVFARLPTSTSTEPKNPYNPYSSIQIEILKSNRFELDWVIESIGQISRNIFDLGGSDAPTTRRVLWRRRNSRILDLPPEGGDSLWEPVDIPGIRDILGNIDRWELNLETYKPRITYNFRQAPPENM